MRLKIKVFKNKKNGQISFIPKKRNLPKEFFKKNPKEIIIKKWRIKS